MIELVKNFSGKKIGVLGDLILDRYIWGKVDRISPEAPVVVLKVEREEERLGGAANVARNLAALGAEVTVFGVVGADSAGSLLKGLLKNDKIDETCVLEDSSRPTTEKSRIIAQIQQVVRVDREESRPLSKELVQQLKTKLEAKKNAFDGFIISDYAKGVYTKEIGDFLISNYKTCPTLIDPKISNFEAYQGVTIIKPNKLEAEGILGRKLLTIDESIQAARELRAKVNSKYCMITLGGKGMVVVGDNDEAYHVHAQKLEVYDVCGAGDTVSAVFLLSIVSGGDLKSCAELANLGGGIVVGEVGTAVVTPAQLMEAIRD